MDVAKLSGPGKHPHHVVMTLEHFPWEGAVVASNVLTRGAYAYVHAYAHMYVMILQRLPSKCPCVHRHTNTHGGKCGTKPQGLLGQS